MAGFQPVRTTLSINDIRAAAWNAAQGSPESYKFLKDNNRRLAKIANQRMKALEKAKLDMNAYNRVKVYLSNRGLERFNAKNFPGQGDYKGMVKWMSELVTFINSKTSTVGGARAALNAKIDKIQEFTKKEYTEEQKLRLGQLLGTDSISTLLNDVKGDSGEVIDALEEISLTDVDTEDITSIIDKYLAGYSPFEDNPLFANFDVLNYDDMMDELRALYQRRDNENNED